MESTANQVNSGLAQQGWLEQDFVDSANGHKSSAEWIAPSLGARQRLAEQDLSLSKT